MGSILIKEIRNRCFMCPLTDLRMHSGVWKDLLKITVPNFSIGVAGLSLPKTLTVIRTSGPGAIVLSQKRKVVPPLNIIMSSARQELFTEFTQDNRSRRMVDLFC